MQLKKRNTLRVAGAVAALAAISVVATSGGAAASDSAKRGDTAVIEIKNNNHPKFVGPETVVQGTGTISVVNHTDPSKIGPHSFSLVEKSALPKNIDEFKDCGKLKPHTVCKNVFKAHDVGPPPDFPIGKPEVEKGDEGWDALFDDEHQKGDSFLLQAEDEETSRSVSADPGNLWYMCIVHPEMQGKIKVVPGR